MPTPPTNQFLPYAPDAVPGLDVTTDAAYGVSPQRAAGHQPGPADRALLNKALRQATAMTAALGELAAAETGENILDDGQLGVLVDQLRKTVATAAVSAGGGLPGGLASLDVVTSGGPEPAIGRMVATGTTVQVVAGGDAQELALIADRVRLPDAEDVLLGGGSGTLEQALAAAGPNPDTLAGATLNGSERVAIKQAGSWFRTNIASIASYANRTFVVSVADPEFGAGWDGVSAFTSTAAVQAAMNSGAGVVFFPDANYQLSQFTIPSSVKAVIGASRGGTVITAVGAFTPFTPFMFFNGCSNFYVGGFTLHVDKTTYATNHAMQFGGCSNGLIEDVQMTSGGYISMYLPACTNITVKDITIDEYAVSMLLADMAPSHITVQNVKGLVPGTGHGMAIQGGSHHKIDKCFVPGAGASFFTVSLYQASDSTVSGSTLIGVTREALQLADGSRNKFFGNTIVCLPGHNDFGISIFADGADIYGNHVYGNTIIGSGGSGVGVSASYTPVVRTCKLNTVENNLILNPNQRDDPEGSGVLLLGGANCTGNVVQNNTCYDESNKMRYGANEWDSGGNPNNNKLIHNACFGGPVLISEANIVGVNSEAYDLTWNSYPSTITSLTGSIAKVNPVLSFFKYKRRGRSAEISARAVITDNGTGASDVLMSIPFTIVNGGPVGRENGVSAKLCYGYSGGPGVMRLAFYDGTYPGASGAQIQVSGIVEI